MKQTATLKSPEGREEAVEYLLYLSKSADNGLQRILEFSKSWNEGITE
jgi:hypothetical protein